MTHPYDHLPPVRIECFADEARELNRRLVQYRHITFEYDGDQCVGQYGRALAYATVDGRLVNRILVERGYARVQNDHPENHPEDYIWENEFLELEAAAQEGKRGMWGACQ